MKFSIRLVATTLTALVVSTVALADSTNWVGVEEFDDAVMAFRIQGKAPSDLAVRVVNKRVEYRIAWDADAGGYSDAIFPTESRAEAEGLIRAYANPENANMLGGDPRLCLHKFARAEDGTKEYFLLYMVDPEVSGLRCIKLPRK